MHNRREPVCSARGDGTKWHHSSVTATGGSDNEFVRSSIPPDSLQEMFDATPLVLRVDDCRQ